MPKKKEITEYNGSLSESYLVNKSRPLLLMREVPFDLGELKVLDTYISRINSEDSSIRTVSFTKDEYEQLTGLKDTRPETLRKHTKAMLHKTVELFMHETGEYVQFNLFTKAVFHRVGDKYRIELSCSEDAKKLFFELDKLHYLQYQLSNVLNLSSKYSYLLYLYLKDNIFRVEWTVSVEELKNKLDVSDNNKLYTQFKYFKRDILIPALNEVNQKTDLNYTHRLIKSGRYIVEIEFTYHPQDPAQLSFSDIEENSGLGISEYLDEDELLREKMGGDEYLAILAEAVKGEFSKEEMEELRLILGRINTPKDRNLSGYDAIIYGKQHYLAEQYAALNTADRKKPVKHRFAYLKTILNADADKQEAMRK